MLPQTLATQIFLNTADLALDFTVQTAIGATPPRGTFVAHMAKDPASVDIDHVFSEARRNLVRGAVDRTAGTTAFTLRASAAEIAGFVGGYTLDLLYVDGAATLPVLRTTFEFTEGV